MRPIAPDLFIDGDTPRLVGGRRFSDGMVVFPLPDGGEADQYEPHPLNPEGRLWSWTVQRFPPKSPPYAGALPFTPYLVGYVELADQVIVEGRLVGLQIEDARIGMTLATTIIPFEMTGGDVVAVHAFRPVTEA